MKSLILATCTSLAGIVLVFFAYACDSTTNIEMDQPELMNLEFTRSAYSAGQALVIRAVPNPEIDSEFFRENPPHIQLTSSDGNEFSAQLSPWSDLSDEEMAEAIKDGPGNAVVRIKEADKESARNSDGELIRSEEAMNNFINWVENHDKLSILRVSVLHPDIDIEFIEEPTIEVVKQVRTHENVEFMEPDQYGEYLSTSSEPAPAGDLASVIIPTESFTWQPGDTVTAEFKQADGTTLKATVTITE